MKDTPRYSQFTWTFSTLGCPLYTLDQVIELARANGLTALELRALEDRVDLPALFQERYGSPAALAAKLKAAGMKVVALDTSFRLSNASDEAKAELLAFVPWAEALGVPFLRVFDGGAADRSPTDDELQVLVDTIKWWRAERQRGGFGCDLFIETHDCLVRMEDVKRLNSLVSPAPAILWDTHHTWKKAGENAESTFEGLSGQVPHIHVKDSVSEPSGHHSFTYTHLGEGEFPLIQTLDLLAERGYTGVVSVEWEKKWHPYLDELPKALAQARKIGLW